MLRKLFVAISIAISLSLSLIILLPNQANAEPETPTLSTSGPPTTNTQKNVKTTAEDNVLKILLNYARVDTEARLKAPAKKAAASGIKAPKTLRPTCDSSAPLFLRLFASLQNKKDSPSGQITAEQPNHLSSQCTKKKNAKATTPKTREQQIKEAITLSASAQLKLPSPSGDMSKTYDPRTGGTIALVNAQSWFWTDPQQYKARQARVQIGNSWFRVTATPSWLLYDPGVPGLATVGCPGPGSAPEPGSGNWRRQPNGCWFAYPYNVRNATPVQTIRWKLNWSADNGETGQLDDMLTSTSLPAFDVYEAQTLVVK